MHTRSTLRNRQQHDPPSRTSSPPSKRTCTDRPAVALVQHSVQESTYLGVPANCKSPPSDSSSDLSLPSTPDTATSSQNSTAHTTPASSAKTAAFDTNFASANASPQDETNHPTLPPSTTIPEAKPPSEPSLSFARVAPPPLAPPPLSPSNANDDRGHPSPPTPSVRACSPTAANDGPTPNILHAPTSHLVTASPDAHAYIPSTMSTAKPDTVESSTPPTTPSTSPRLTGDLVCHESEMDRARIINVDAWVPMDTILRLRLFGEYSDHVTPAFSIANIPSTATWGTAHQYCDMTSYLCIENKAVTASFTGTVIKKWFYDYQGNPQSPAKICVRASRAIDLASANYWLSQTKPPKPVNHDVIWASRLMLQWPEDLEVDKPDVVPFTAVYDSTQRFANHDDDNQKTTRFFDVGDVVFVEAFITRYKTKGSKAAAWSQYQVGFELQSIDVIARNPVRPNGFSRPAVPTRNLNI